MKKKYIYIISILIFVVLLFGFTKDYYYKLNKSFEIFGSVIKALNETYVLELDPELLVKEAIRGMLSTLDPYTEYYDASEQDEVDLLTDGTYTGFGISLSNIDSMLTITNLLDNYSAQLAGLRIGDRIVKIDGTNVLYRNYDDVRYLFKGEAGTKSNLLIMRDGNPDTLEFELTRKKIQLKSVSYYAMLDSNTAYIKIEQFKKDLIIEFKNALAELKRKNNLKSLIIDLRDNPGGFIGASVDICELFLPKNSVITTTRGREESNVYEYKTSFDPIEPNLPLAVLINKNTASASEIVAGALQDYDRAVIIGQRSYGKGLVQTVLEQPYNGNIKITTSKYYTPSGRCIQRLKFGQKYQDKSIVEDSPDTNIYYTKNGRKVYEATGINPDTLVENKLLSEILSDMYNKYLFFKYANLYTSKLNDLPKNFKADDKLFEKFQKFLTNNEYEFQSNVEYIFDEFKKITEKNKNYSKNFDINIKSIQKELKNENLNLLKQNKNDILKYLDFEIKARFYSEKELITLYNSVDNELEVAKFILQKDIYKRILSS